MSRIVVSDCGDLGCVGLGCAAGASHRHLGAARPSLSPNDMPLRMVPIRHFILHNLRQGFLGLILGRFKVVQVQPRSDVKSSPSSMSKKTRGMGAPERGMGAPELENNVR